MSDTDTQVPLPDLNSADAPAAGDDIAYNEDENAARIAADLEAVFDVPVQVSAVLGRSKMDVGDLLKLERHMIFVNNDEVNLFEYLRERRTKKAVCASCPHSVFCGGFYELDDVPEPTWLVRPEDLVRPVSADIP